MRLSLPQIHHWRIAGTIVLVLLGHALLMTTDAHGRARYDTQQPSPAVAALHAPQQQKAGTGRRVPKHRTACGAVQLAAQPPNGSDRQLAGTEAGASPSMAIPNDDESSPGSAERWGIIHFDLLTANRAILQVFLN